MSFSIQQHEAAQELVARAQQHLDKFRALRQPPSAPPNGQNDSIETIRQTQLPTTNSSQLTPAEMRAQMRARRAERPHNPLPVSPTNPVSPAK